MLVLLVYPCPLRSAAPIIVSIRLLDSISLLANTCTTTTSNISDHTINTERVRSILFKLNRTVASLTPTQLAWSKNREILNLPQLLLRPGIPPLPVQELQTDHSFESCSFHRRRHPRRTRHLPVREDGRCC